MKKSIMILLAFTTFLGCGDVYNVKNFNVSILDVKERPYWSQDVVSLDAPVHHSDADQVPLFVYKGKRYYHPVTIAQVTLSLINSYYLTHDNRYLNRADLYLKKLIKLSTPYQGGIYFPYMFDFNLHAGNDVMKAPWYSAMAQGQVLSCLSRMYAITKDKTYLDYAWKVFRSLKNVKSYNSKIWVTTIDKDKFIWLEEYPMEPNTHALNGTIFAIFGLYDFYTVVPDNKDVKDLLQGSITTIQNKISSFRSVGDVSYYCLLHKIQNKKYHAIHTDQLNFLYKITGDKYFLEMSELFKQDYH